MAHLLRHDAIDREQVVVARRVLEERALLLHRGELGVALIDDQRLQRVADALIGDVHHRRPLALALVVAELDLVDLQVAELHVELVVLELLRVEADVILPEPEQVDPVIEVADLCNAMSHAP